MNHVVGGSIPSLGTGFFLRQVHVWFSFVNLLRGTDSNLASGMFIEACLVVPVRSPRLAWLSGHSVSMFVSFMYPCHAIGSVPWLYVRVLRFLTWPIRIMAHNTSRDH